MLSKHSDHRKIDKKDSLPKDRKEQFFLLLRNNYMKMVVFSMISFLFIVPIIVLFVVMNYQTSLLLRQEGANLANVIFSSCLFFCLYSSPFIALLSLSMAGLFFIMKGLVYDEPVSYSSFFTGIKKNWKSFLLIGYFVYLFFVLFLLTLARFLYFVAVPTLVRYALIFCSGFIFLIVFSMGEFMCTAATRYESNFPTLVANAFRLTFHKLYLNLLLALLSLLPWVLAIIFNVIAEMIAFLLLFVYLLSFFALLLTSYHASLYDELINKNNFPSKYRDGLDKA